MAVDRKADHVGNHGGAYTDIDGMRKQFTYVDHDKKTKISTRKGEDIEVLKRANKDHTYTSIRALLSMPAISVIRNQDGLYEEFIIRDQEKGIIWNDTMVFDACSINGILLYNMFNLVWKNTVKEQYWFEDMSYEDIIGGEWKKWS